MEFEKSFRLELGGWVILFIQLGLVLLRKAAKSFSFQMQNCQNFCLSLSPKLEDVCNFAWKEQLLVEADARFDAVLEVDS